MKIHDVMQGTPEWMRLHFGKVTASELGNLMTAKFEPRTGEMPHTYLCKKVAEAYRNAPLPGFASHSTDYGIEMEVEARGWAGMQEKDAITQVGFIETDDGLAGCSPDGLIGEDGGLEIKCPNADTHVKYFLKAAAKRHPNEKVPAEYITQVHHSLYVTGRPWWKFISYRPKFPKLVIVVDRDESIISRIGEVVHQFSERFEDALNQLKLQEQ